MQIQEVGKRKKKQKKEKKEANVYTKICFSMSFWIFIGKKGNSLFAEVDDQRQAMRHDMKSMRDKYLFVS